MDIRITTELDAVNTMLATIGEQPVNSLETASTSDVAQAVRALGEQNREVQSEGWTFNTEIDYDLVLNDEDQIVLPTTALAIEFEDYSDIDPVERAGKAYDRKNKTFTIDRDLVARRLTLLLNFTELPEAARHYITIKAARVFQYRVRGSSDLHAYTERDEFLARRLLRKYQSDVSKSNILQADGVIQILTGRAPRVV
jgi:hypothetical protein